MNCEYCVVFILFFLNTLLNENVIIQLNSYTCSHVSITWVTATWVISSPFYKSRNGSQAPILQPLGHSLAQETNDMPRWHLPQNSCNQRHNAFLSALALQQKTGRDMRSKSWERNGGAERGTDKCGKRYGSCFMSWWNRQGKMRAAAWRCHFTECSCA